MDEMFGFFYLGAYVTSFLKSKKIHEYMLLNKNKNYFKTITNLYLYINSCLPDIFGNITLSWHCHLQI